MTGKKILRVAAATVLSAAPLMAQATNGYFAHGFSAAQKALGGAGTALPEDSLVATINPAGMVWVGDSFDMNLSLFTPIRSYSATEVGPNAQQGIVTLDAIDENRSHNEYYPLPAMAFNRSWGEKYSWGIAMYGNGGLNTEYREPVNTTFASGFQLTENQLAGLGALGLPPSLVDDLLGAVTAGALPTNLEEECIGSLGGGDLVSGPGNFCGEKGRISGVDLAILFVAPTVSMKLGDRSSIGLSVLGALSRFGAQGLGAFEQFSNDPDRVTNNGHDIALGGGYRVGFLTGLIPFVNLGASYQSRVWMDEFDKYSGLFAKQGDFDVPETWNVGLAFRLGDNLRVIADYQRINYSTIASVGNDFDPNAFVNNCAMPRLFAALGFGGSTEDSDDCLGSAVGPGFGWNDMEVYKFGVQYTFGGFKFRAGYSTTDQPIDSTQVLFNKLAPGVMEQHFTAGVSMRWTENMFVDIALMYAPEVEITGKNPLSNTSANFFDLLGADGVSLTGTPLDALLLGGAGAVFGSGTDLATGFGPDEDDQDLILRMKQFELTVGLAWRF